MAFGRVDSDGETADDSISIVAELDDIGGCGNSGWVVEETVEGPEVGVEALTAVAGGRLGLGGHAVLHELLHFLGTGELEGGVGLEGHVHGLGVDDGVGDDHA